VIVPESVRRQEWLAEVLAEEFVERRRRGEHPSLSEYTRSDAIWLFFFIMEIGKRLPKAL
jgi:hypothetical protein